MHRLLYWSVMIRKLKNGLNYHYFSSLNTSLLNFIKSTLPPLNTVPILYPSVILPSSIIFSIPAIPSTPVGLMIYFYLSAKNFIHHIRRSSGTWTMGSISSFIILSVSSPILGVLAPSAMVYWLGMDTTLFYRRDSEASWAASGSTAWTLQLGLWCLATRPAPETSPPPPMPTNMWSRWPTS